MEDIMTILEGNFDDCASKEDMLNEIKLLESNGFEYLISEAQEEYDFGPDSEGARLKQYMARRG